MISGNAVGDAAQPRAPLAPQLSVHHTRDTTRLAALLVLSVLYFVLHAAALPATFGDLDEINFALGVRDFDVARHQPHPPGYPVFIGAAKISTALLRGVGLAAPEVRGLAVLSAIAGAVLLPLLFVLLRELTGDRRVAMWGAVVTVCSPLVWFNALRPLSDTAGLAVVVLAQGLIVSVMTAPRRDAARRLILGAALSGLAIGIRSQNFTLTLPLLLVALVVRHPSLTLHDRMRAVLAGILAGLVWGIPLIAASGGLEAYVAALRNQAGEDFSGVVMLWTARSARVAVDAIRHTFLWPWGTLAAGWVVLFIAAAGAVRMLIFAPRTLAILTTAFVPYAVFHLLFQETVTIRYALPLVIPMALCAVYALSGAGRILLHGGGAALVAWSMALTLPAARVYSSRPAPAVSAVTDAIEGSTNETVAMHAVMRRTEQWYHDNASGRVLLAAHGREVDALVQQWRTEPARAVMFIADPRRSDLARLDPRSRALTRTYEWGFPEQPFVGGTRPGEAHLYSLSPPGWMLGEGWAVTAEVAGQTVRAGAEPHRKPAIAWVRARDGESRLLIGGRNLTQPGSASGRITMSITGSAIASFDAAPGYFFETRTLPGGQLTGADTYLPLQVTVGGPVSLEQFDLQPSGVPMVGYLDGWHEPEYNPALGRSWRWMSQSAALWVPPVGRDVTLTLSAENPLRYFDQSPTLRVSVGEQVLARFTPAADFTREVRIPRELLVTGNARVTIESDRSFVPGKGDARALALRVYSVTVN